MAFGWTMGIALGVQIRPPRDVRGRSVTPPKAAVNADLFARPVRAKSGREQTQQQMELVDHLVGESQQPVRHIKVECPGCLEVEHELEFG